MGCMADKESSVQEDFDDIAFERVDFGKKETASSFIQKDLFTPSKIELQKDPSETSFQQEEQNKEEMEKCTQILEQYDKCSHFYSEHDIDSAHVHAVSLENRLKEIRQIVDYSCEELPLFEKDIKQMQKLIGKVKKEYLDVQSYQDQIYKGGWVEKSNKKGIKISTRREQSTVGVLVQSIIDVPCQVLIAVLIQMDLYKRFIPFMEVSRQEKIIARNCRLGYSCSSIPLLTKRQAFYQGVAYNRMKKDNTLFLYTRSIHNSPNLQNELDYKANINKDYVQFDYKYFVVKYKPLTKTEGQITFAMNVDTKLQLVPLWLQDKISQDYGQNFLLNITKLGKKFKGSQWQKNVQQNPHMFNFCKEKIHEHLENSKKDAKTD